MEASHSTVRSRSPSPARADDTPAAAPPDDAPVQVGETALVAVPASSPAERQMVGSLDAWVNELGGSLDAQVALDVLTRLEGDGYRSAHVELLTSRPAVASEIARLLGGDAPVVRITGTRVDWPASEVPGRALIELAHALAPSAPGLVSRLLRAAAMRHPALGLPIRHASALIAFDAGARAANSDIMVTALKVMNALEGFDPQVLRSCEVKLVTMMASDEMLEAKQTLSDLGFEIHITGLGMATLELDGTHFDSTTHAQALANYAEKLADVPHYDLLGFFAVARFLEAKASPADHDAQAMRRRVADVLRGCADRNHPHTSRLVSEFNAILVGRLCSQLEARIDELQRTGQHAERLGLATWMRELQHQVKKGAASPALAPLLERLERWGQSAGLAQADSPTFSAVDTLLGPVLQDGALVCADLDTAPHPEPLWHVLELVTTLCGSRIDSACLQLCIGYAANHRVPADLRRSEFMRAWEILSDPRLKNAWGALVLDLNVRMLDAALGIDIASSVSTCTDVVCDPADGLRLDADVRRAIELLFALNEDVDSAEILRDLADILLPEGELSKRLGARFFDRIFKTRDGDLLARLLIGLNTYHASTLAGTIYAHLLAHIAPAQIVRALEVVVPIYLSEVQDDDDEDDPVLGLINDLFDIATRLALQEPWEPLDDTLAVVADMSKPWAYAFGVQAATRLALRGEPVGASSIIRMVLEIQDIDDVAQFGMGQLELASGLLLEGLTAENRQGRIAYLDALRNSRHFRDLEASEVFERNCARLTDATQFP